MTDTPVSTSTYIDEVGNLVVSAYSKYTPEQHINAVAAYLQIGNLKGTSREVGVPTRTLFDWRTQDWWKALSKRYLDEMEDELRARWQKLAIKSLKAAEERIDNGDEIFDSRSGDHKRVKVKAKDATIMAALGYDKQRLSLNLPSKITEVKGSEQLQDLAKAFQTIAEKAKNEKAADSFLAGEPLVEVK